MKSGFTTIDARFWRMLGIRWQGEPISGDGAKRHGGRWNRIGQEALYLSADPVTAIAEYHQNIVRPGTLAAYDIDSAAIVDLTDQVTRAAFDIGAADLTADWQTMVAFGRGEPPGWRIADRLIRSGAHGALVPSARFPPGPNLVLWRWSLDGTAGASVRVIDPLGDLSG